VSARFAFSAQFWGDRAVVCRAVEEQPGPVVEQQFGEFHSWTKALSFANKLNEGLNLDPLEVRQIVTSSLLATASLLEESLNCRRQWNTAALETRAAQSRFVMAEVTLALSFCRSASLLSRPSAQRVHLSARNALQRASRFLGVYPDDDPQIREVASRTHELAAAFESLRSSFRSSSLTHACWPECWPGDPYPTKELERAAKVREAQSIALLCGRAVSQPLLCMPKLRKAEPLALLSSHTLRPESSEL